MQYAIIGLLISLALLIWAFMGFNLPEPSQYIYFNDIEPAYGMPDEHYTTDDGAL
jgi:hypothetical protein